LPHSFRDDEEKRDEENPENRRREHAAEYGRADGVAGRGAGALSPPNLSPSAKRD